MNITKNPNERWPEKNAGVGRPRGQIAYFFLDFFEYFFHQGKNVFARRHEAQLEMKKPKSQHEGLFDL